MNTNEEYVIPIIRNKNKLFINYNGRSYDLSPSIAVQLSIPPNIMGVDKVIDAGLKIKNIQNDSAKLIVSRDYFLKCDVNLIFDKKMYNGWIYSIKGESLNLENEQKVWICPYIKLFFENPPNELFLKIE